MAVVWCYTGGEGGEEESLLSGATSAEGEAGARVSAGAGAEAGASAAAIAGAEAGTSSDAAAGAGADTLILDTTTDRDIIGTDSALVLIGVNSADLLAVDGTQII